jgi:predicted nucleic acid-binding protein
MAPANVIDIRSYTFKREDCLLLDTNIWLSIFGPDADPEDRRAKIYSAALKKMREYNCKIFLDVLILCEFINRFAHWEYDQLDSAIRPPKFKDFRKSPIFKPVAEEIVLKTNKILKMTKCCDSGFELMDLKQMLSEYETGRMDFNDQILYELCKAKRFILVTDDKDFKATEISILTMNRALLEDH